MIILDRLYTTEANLTGSNLVENDAPEWDVATTYAAGDEVIVSEFHRVYVSAINSNLGTKPLEGGDPAVWILKGATNKWAPFDDLVANRASNADTITYQFTVQSKVTSVAFFGLQADSISINVSKDTSSIDYTADLLSVDHINGSLWNWITGGRPRAQEYAFTDLAYFGAGTVISVTIDLTGGTAQVGAIVMGAAENIGKVETMPEISKQSFSRYSEDEFGNIIVVKRLPAKLTRMTVARKSANVRYVENVLDRALDTFTVFIGSDDAGRGLLLFGVLRDAPITIETRDFHRIQLEIRSLI